MALPLSPPVAPQLARSRAALPEGEGWAYEPKWDGFRAIAFVDGDDVYLQSRNGKPLNRYFPELRFPPRPLRARRRDRDPRRATAARSSTLLGQRIHPAAVAHRPPRRGDAGALRRVRPAGPRRRDAARAAVRERRAALEELVDGAGRPDPVRRSTRARPSRGCRTPRASIAKQLDAPYRPGERNGHGQDQARAHDRRGRRRLAAGQGRGHRRLADPRPLRRRTASCAWSATRPGFTAKEKRELVDRWRPTRPASAAAASLSRWTQGRELEWVKLRPELVVEVTFDHVSDGRIRHGAKVQRWRDDKDPRGVPVDQLDS